MQQARRKSGLMMAAVAVLALAGCGKQAQDPAPGSADTASPEAKITVGVETAAGPIRPAAFAQCAACHTTQPGVNGVGPSLAGIYGTKAGDVAGYVFSDALKNSGLTWDDATLDKWIAGPAKLVPGTRMTFVGISDPVKRKEVIAYLKALK